MKTEIKKNQDELWQECRRLNYTDWQIAVNNTLEMDL